MVSSNVIVIHDQNPQGFTIWLFLMVVIFILYCVVTTVHDIRREKRLEEIRREIEARKEEKDLEEI